MRYKRKNGAGQATRVIALSFGAVILTGTLLLMLPFASHGGTGCGLLTALFTATSATCVTGLVLVDTLTGWTVFGQLVILLLIQIGGLGFMTMIYLFTVRFRHRSSLSQRLMMVSAFNLDSMSDVSRVVKNAIRTTLVMEGGGAVILTLCFIPRYGWAALWKGVFISVSAFCNAGFDILGPDGIGSISTYADHPLVLLTLMVLIVSGGLGFFVWEEIRSRKCYRSLSLYSKMVLWLTGGLILFGGIFVLLTEWGNPDTLGSMPLWQKVVNAFFQSVTLRTAGFASVDQGAMREATLAVSVMLMLVGGSSGSTAGGLKTVTVGVLLLSLRAGLRGEERVVLRGRTIPQRKVLSAVTLVSVVVFLFIAAAVVITLADGVPFLFAAFETASAIATVGLTTGITGGLSTLSRLVIIALMYLGRVGVLSFSLAFLTRSGGGEKISYPETNVMIG